MHQLDAGITPVKALSFYDYTAYGTIWHRKISNDIGLLNKFRIILCIHQLFPLVDVMRKVFMVHYGKAVRVQIRQKFVDSPCPPNVRPC